MMTHTCTHTYAHPWSYVCTNPHTHIWCAPFTALPGVLPLHTHTSSCLLEIWLMMTHTYTPIPMPTLECLHKHIFLLHVYRSSRACGDTRDLRSYFTSVRRVFLVETVLFQTVLWDIRTWSARYLVIYMINVAWLISLTKIRWKGVHFTTMINKFH